MKPDDLLPAERRDYWRALARQEPPIPDEIARQAAQLLLANHLTKSDATASAQ